MELNKAKLKIVNLNEAYELTCTLINLKINANSLTKHEKTQVKESNQHPIPKHKEFDQLLVEMLSILSCPFLTHHHHLTI